MSAEEMTGPLLVGYDGSEQSRDALALTRLLGGLNGRPVIALAVITLAPTEATWFEYERIQKEEVDRLGREVRAGLEGLPRVEFQHVLAPSPAHEIHDAAVETGAGMIVLGSTHRGRIGRVLPGSVADRLLSAAPCPVAVAPRGYRDRHPRIRSVTVAYDGSPEAELALEEACRLAAAAGGSLRVISVANPEDARVAVPGAAGWAGIVTTPEGIEEERRRVADRLDAAVARLEPALNASGEVIVDTHPAAVIADAGEDSDLLVMGSRGYGPLGRVLLGGVASHVIRNAACPVIVTARPGDE
jgi:nucleotide-binding universal stress UspA family protein